ncbi:MAG TPA: hypothetical protein VM577_08310 [Anaerovoracaceae bacterium]|nr:hypothetical protein [Anaerovoracaceae bacterium]
MIELLQQMDDELDYLLRDPNRWQTLDINYDKPRVERVWTQWGEYRINLHRIHPCEEAFFHPHPWPSVISIISGRYEMAIGFGAGLEEPPVAARIILADSSAYEMLNPDGWHYVRPIGGPVMSIMITGKPWSREMPKSDKVVLSSLTDEVKKEIMDYFWWNR